MIEKFITEFLLAFLIENKTVILMGLGFIFYSGLEYFLGNSKHKSLVGFLKFVISRKKKDEPKI